jgi:predicted AAA+ superfamily ATPase
VAGYLEILEQTLIGFPLPAYEAKLRIRERRHPKWYWCDPGIVRAMKHATGVPSPEERGALFEGLVAQTLRAYRDYRTSFDEMFYWAPAENAAMEVDFLLKKGDFLAAVEVKSGRTFQNGWCKGLRAISKLDGLRRRILVYPDGPSLRTEDGIEAMPFAPFARLLSENNLWPK